MRRRSSKNIKTCSRFVAGKNPKGQKSLLPPCLQYMSPYMNTYNHLVCGATHKASLGLLDEFSGKGRSWINPRFCGHSIARIFSEVRSIFQIIIIITIVYSTFLQHKLNSLPGGSLITYKYLEIMTRKYDC